MPEGLNIGQSVKKSGCAKFLLFAVLPLFLFCFLTLLALHMNADSSLDERVTQLEAELTNYRASQRFQRRPRFGPTKKGNAVDYYNAMEYLTAMRPEWKTNPPANLPRLGPLKVFAARPDESLYLTTRRLDRRLHTIVRNRGAKLDKEEYGLRDVDRERIQAFLPMLKFVEEGLRCDRVEWPATFEMGPAMSTASALTAKFVANLLAHKARNEMGSEKVKWGLKICAFGEDYARGPTLAMVSTAMNIQSMGYRSLQESMESPLSAKDYQRIISFMALVPKIDRVRTMRGEAFLAKSTLAYRAGRRVNEVHVPELNNARAKRLDIAFQLGRSTSSLAHDWGDYEKFYRKYVLPAAEAKSEEVLVLKKQLNAELDKSWSEFTRLCFQDLFWEFRYFDDLENKAKLVSLLAAAHLHRLKTGTFPEKIDLLADYYPNKNLPQNSSGMAALPFGYELEDGQVTVWVQGSDYVIYRTWVPN